MHKLNNYRIFDTEKFIKTKKLAFLKGKYQSDDKFKGITATIIILEDAAEENQGEQFTVKIADVPETLLSQFKMFDIIQLYDVTKATVYGEYQNQLSIHAKIRKIGNNNNH